MSKPALLWLNVDRPTKTAVLHSTGCRHERAKMETPLKGIGALKKDGG